MQIGLPTQHSLQLAAVAPSTERWSCTRDLAAFTTNKAADGMARAIDLAWLQSLQNRKNHRAGGFRRANQSIEIIASFSLESAKMGRAG